MIRRHQASDIDEIIALEREVLDTSLDRKIFELALTSELAYYYVYEEDNKILGYISSMFDGEIIEILNFCVKKEYQNKHIGTKLFSQVLKELYSKGAKSVILEVRESNLNAINFYKRFGLKKISVRKNYYKNGENALVLQKVFIDKDEIEREYLKCFCKIKDEKNYIKYSDDIQKDKYCHNFYFIKDESKLDKLLFKLEKDNDKEFLEIDSKTRLNLPEFEEDEEIRMYSPISSIKEDYRLGEVKVLEIDNKNDYYQVEYKTSVIYGESYAKSNALRLTDELINNDNLIGFVIYNNDIPVGTVHAFKYKECAKIEGFVVLDEYQKKGYGISLFSYVVKYLKSIGIYDLYLTADNLDTPKEIYYKLGFDLLDYNYNYHKDL